MYIQGCIIIFPHDVGPWLFAFAWTAEKDKQFFEDKLSSSMNALDSQKQQMDHLSLKLVSAEEIIRNR